MSLSLDPFFARRPLLPLFAAWLRRMQLRLQNLRADMHARHPSRSWYCRFASADEAWQVARHISAPGPITNYHAPLSVLGVELAGRPTAEQLHRSLRKPRYTLRFHLGTAPLEYQFFRPRKLPERTFVQCCLVEGEPFFIQLISAGTGRGAATFLTEVLEKKYGISLRPTDAKHTIRDTDGASLIIGSTDGQRTLTYVFAGGARLAAGLCGDAPAASHREERRKALARMFAAL